MSQSLMTTYYNSDEDLDSNNSAIVIQDYGRTVSATPFTPIGNQDPGK